MHILTYGGFFFQGERTVDNYEVADEAPYLFGNTTINLQTLHQGLSFLPQKFLDVRGVEVARAWRLTNSSVEPITFTVPRVRVGRSVSRL
jgi:coronin-7